jgi:hypothetical protein
MISGKYNYPTTGAELECRSWGQIKKKKIGEAKII